MSDINKFSVGLIDAAERFADVVDAAQGNGGRKERSGAKWLLLPAAGAGAYALATSSSKVARQTRRLMSRAKDRATDLPDTDLLRRVKDVTGVAQESGSGSNGRSRSTSGGGSRRRTSQAQRRRRTTTSKR